MVELDGGDSFAYDELSRITATNRGPDPEAATPVRVRTVEYDLGGRPRAEAVGLRAELEWTWDAWDRPETVSLPGGVGRDPAGAFTGFERQWDSLDRQVGIGGLGRADLGADLCKGARYGGYDVMMSSPQFLEKGDGTSTADTFAWWHLSRVQPDVPRRARLP